MTKLEERIIEARKKVYKRRMFFYLMIGQYEKADKEKEKLNHFLDIPFYEYL